MYYYTNLLFANIFKCVKIFYKVKSGANNNYIYISLDDKINA